MKKYVMFLVCLCISFSATLPSAEAQWGSKKKEVKRKRKKKKSREAVEAEGHEVVKELDRIDSTWHVIADKLGTYAGLSKYCTEAEYKKKVNTLLDEVHHYDTLLYQILIRKAELEGDGKTLKRTIKEVEKVETKYKPKSFARKLKDDCKGRNYIEKYKKKLKRDVQMESYDGQALVIDNDIHAYIKRITHLLDLIDKHAHHLLD